MPPGVIHSVTRALDVLAVIAGRAEGLALNEIATRAALKPPTAHKIVRTLAARGFVERTARPIRYRLGRAVLDLVWGHIRSSQNQRAAEAVERLSREFPAGTVTFCRAIGGEVMTVFRMSPERPGLMETPTDRRMSPYVSASSLVFQAYWTAEERNAFRLRYPFVEHGAHFWKEMAALDAFLAEVRRTGAAVLRAASRGICPVAVPVFDADNVLQGTLGMSISASPDDEELVAPMTEALKAAAQAAAAPLL